MAPLTFTDKHNMVAYLSKSNASEDKKVNDVVQLRALIDGKKVVVLEAIIRSDLHLDDAERYLSAKRTAWNEFRNVDSLSKFLMYPHFLQVVLDNQADDLTTHNTRYTSPALTRKVFANMRRVRNGCSGVKTPLFAFMLVQPQPQAEEEEVEMPITPALPSPISAPSPPLQDQPFTPHASPPQEQPTTISKSSMSLLTYLMETCATLSQMKKRSKSLGFKRLRMVGTSQRVESSTDTVLGAQEDVVIMDAESQGRINQEEVNAASKDVSVAEPTVFDDEDVTMTMAQTLIKLKAEKAKLLDEQIS
uniref:Uncharacterized protein n=1 Tax=Tanacetum cinerariifolium TaxID=118510 RepID=A0A699II55_TANCI|nr:hypothetical protein [Tanacetum cinerariifolium]